MAQVHLFRRKLDRLPPEKEVTSLHIPLVAMLRWCLAPHVLMRHVPNGEHRDPRTAAKLKAMGTLAGSADLEFHWRDDGGLRKMLHLELKVGNRQPSDAQDAFARIVVDLGDEYLVVRSIDGALTILGARGLLRNDIEIRGRRR